MQIIHKIKMFMILVSLQPTLLFTAECKESELFSDENEIQLYVDLCPHLDEGFKVLQECEQSIPTFYDYLKTHIKISDEITSSSENNTFIDEKYPDLGNVIEEAESVIANQMKDSFLTIFEDAIKKPFKDIYEINDPIFRYVMNHRDGFMKPIVRDWIKSKNSNDGTFLSTAVEHDNFQAVKILLAAGCNHLTRSHRYHETAYRRHYLYLCQLRVDKKDCNWRQNIFTADDESIQRNFIIIDDYFYNYKNIQMLQNLSRREFLFFSLRMRKKCGMIKITFENDRLNNRDDYALLDSSGAHYLLKRRFVHSYKFGVTPLHQAVANNSLEMMQMLIDDHIDVDSKDILDTTPLHVAAENNLVQAMHLLIDAGAHVNAKNILGLTPLHCAIKNNSIDSFMFLISTPGVDLQHKVVPISLCIAYITGTSIFKDAGKTPLFLAVETRNIEMVKKLLEAGVDPNIKNDKNHKSDGRTDTPLHRAVEYNLREIIDILLDAAADINIQNNFGRTSLHYACDHDETWFQLMRHNPNLQIQSNNNETPEQLRVAWLSAHAAWQERQRHQARQQASCCMIS